MFAIKWIAKGTDVFRNSKKDAFYYWDIITNDEMRSLIKKLCHTTADGFLISDHPVNLGMSYYVNHSDQPNVEFDKKLDTFVSIRDICKGEELLVRYPEEERDWLI